MLLCGVPLTLLLADVVEPIVEQDRSVLTARGESLIILEPVDAHDALRMMGRELLVDGALMGVEVVQIDVLAVGDGEHVTSIGEADLVTVLRREV